MIIVASMHRIPFQITSIFLLVGCLFAPFVHAAQPQPILVTTPPPISFVDRATATVQDVIDQAVDLLGIPYRHGGSSLEAGFDCSGFVTHVFREGLGLVLPRTSKELSKTGEAIDEGQLQPGDLVFFNTMRHAFSHVGIYLGNNQFVHAPRAGGRIRIEDLRDRYWKNRFNGARRVSPE